MLTDAKNSSAEIINDGKWIFSKLINAHAEASAGLMIVCWV